jgi:hypothetical protein
MIQRLTTAGTKFTNIKDTVEYGISGIKEGKWDDTSVPNDYLRALPLSAKEQIFLIRIYFQELYPETTPNHWNSIGDTEIVKMYRNLDFWYTFNTMPDSDPDNPNALKPYPILLDDAPVSKWMNIYPFTAVQSGVCTLGAGKKGKLGVKQISRFPLASGKISKNLPAEEQYWRSVRSLEVIPLKLNGTWRGPLKGSGIFLELPQRTIVGVSARHIELQCSGELPDENDNILSNWNTDFSTLPPVNLENLKDLVSGKTGILEETDSWAFIITHYPDDCGELMIIICTNCTPKFGTKFSITNPLQNLLRIKQATKTYPPPHNIAFIKKYGPLIGGISGCGISIIFSIIVAFLPIKFKGGETIKTVLCIILIFVACLIFGMYICPKWILTEPIKNTPKLITQPPEPLQPNEQIKIYLKMIYPDTDIFDYANEKSIIQYYSALNYSYPIPYWTPPIEMLKKIKASYSDILEVTGKWGEAPWGTLFDIVKGSGIALKLGKYIVGPTVTAINKELAASLENRWLVYTPLGGSQTYQFYSDFFEEEGKLIVELHSNAPEVNGNYNKFFDINSGLWIEKECSSPFSKENKQYLMLPWKYQLWILSEKFRNKVSECNNPLDIAIDEIYDRRDSMDDPKILAHLGKTLKFNSAILSVYSKIVHFDLVVPRKTHPFEPWKKFVNSNLFLFNPNGETKEPLSKSWISPPVHSLDSTATCSHKIGLSIHKSSNSWASDILKLDQTTMDPENEIYSTHKDG